MNVKFPQINKVGGTFLVTEKGRLKFLYPIIGLLMAVLIVVVPASPADAHGVIVQLPRPHEAQGAASVSPGHYEFTACDNYADGWGVRGYFMLESETIVTVWDTNGSRPGCGHGNGGGIRAVRFFVCFGPNGQDRVCSRGKDA